MRYVLPRALLPDFVLIKLSPRDLTMLMISLYHSVPTIYKSQVHLEEVDRSAASWPGHWISLVPILHAGGGYQQTINVCPQCGNLRCRPSWVQSGLRRGVPPL